MDKFAIAWTLWIIAFVVIEAVAVFDGKAGGTLSEGIWVFLSGGPARYLLLIGLLSWLVIHFLGRGKYG